MEQSVTINREGEKTLCLVEIVNLRIFTTMISLSRVFVNCKGYFSEIQTKRSHQ